MVLICCCRTLFGVSFLIFLVLSEGSLSCQWRSAVAEVSKLFSDQHLIALQLGERIFWFFHF